MEGRDSCATADIGMFGRSGIDQADLDALAVAERAHVAASSAGDAGHQQGEGDGIANNFRVSAMVGEALCAESRVINSARTIRQALSSASRPLDGWRNQWSR